MTTNAEFLTTGIGSLPYPNIDSALEHSFHVDIPFLPQIPIRNPKEFMIAQALSILPGLKIDSDANAYIDLDEWSHQAATFQDKLDLAISNPEELSYFSPDTQAWTGWKPFLFECDERQVQTAKVQIAGPLTCQWALQDQEGKPITQREELSSQVFKLIMTRSLSMIRSLNERKIKPILFIDEPALYLLDAQNPNHIIYLQQLKILIALLKKENARIGLHCCSQTKWNSVFDLGLDFISIDTRLSLESITQHHKAELSQYLKQGGKLSLGVIPTSIQEQATPHLLAIVDSVVEAFHEHQSLLPSFIYTPACGLALHSPESAQRVLYSLKDFKKQLIRKLNL